MKYLIFSDIDGTIRPNTGDISTFTAKAIKRIQKNAEFVLVSGRGRQKVEEFASLWGGCRYIISTNGAELFDCKKREIIYTSTISKESVLKLYNLAERHGLRIFFGIEDDYRLTNHERPGEDTEKQIYDINEEIKKHTFIGGVITDIKEEILNEIKAEITSTEDVVVANYGGYKGVYYMDFTSAYANKGVAIKKLIKHLNVDPTITMSFGNEKNDIPMFLATHTSITVGDASEELKNIVDIVVDTAENDGVAKHLNSLDID